MTDRDDDAKRPEDEPRSPGDQGPEEGSGADAGPDAPAPATWAGRRRTSSEDAGEHPQLDEAPAADEVPDQSEAPGGEASDAEPPAEAESGDEPTGGPDDGAELEDDAEPSARVEEDAEPPAEIEDEDEAPAGAADTAERMAQPTVEANTLALGDREAAREAALKGVRARAAQKAAKQAKAQAQGQPATPAPQAPQAAAEPQAPADARAQAEQPPAAVSPTAPPPEAEEDGPARRGIWARFAAGSLLIIVAMATATSLSLLLFLNGVLDGFRGFPGVQNELAVAHPGDPQTILILGSDKRPGEAKEFGARSDTTILLRIASDQITVLSIPRDLKVNIKGHGIDRFNAAYTYGGAKLTVKTVKQLTGITDINHVVNVDFNGFADAVNSIGCVYVDVDRHYYNSNLGVAPEEQYAEIDIPAGYQRMCGNNALQYVRYRHEDNDLVRSARQQEFLREMRQELPAPRILDDYDEFKDILHEYVTLDIRNETDLITLVSLLVSARNAPVVQVNFPANLGGPNASYVTASQSAIRQAVAKFQGETPTPTPSSSESGTGGGGSGGGGGGDSGGGGSGGKPPEQSAPPPLIDSTVSGQEVAAQLAAAKTKTGVKRMLNFPVYYPTKLAPDSIISDDSRAFPIDGPGDEVYHGYKIVATMPTDGYQGYYGVSGTDWEEPPILSNPDETREVDGKEYLLSWDGPDLRLIGWKTDRASYWIDNTLLNVLTPGQMFGIAESMREYTG